MTASEEYAKAAGESPMKGAPVIDFDKFKPTRSMVARRKRHDVAMAALISVAFVVALIPLFSVLWTTISNGVQRLNLNFLSYNMSGVIGGRPTASGGYGGISTPSSARWKSRSARWSFRCRSASYCSVFLIEYSRGGKFAKSIGLLVDVMSGVPSIVASLFAFSMFTILVGPGTFNGFEGSVALSLLMIPTVVKSSEEMLKIVPNDLREASYALGVTKQRTITKIVLRTALPGIVSGVIGDCARGRRNRPLLMTAGYISTTNVNLFSGQMTTLPVYVYQEYSKLKVACPASAGASCVTDIPMQRAWAAALMLIVIVLILNLIGRLVARVFAVKSER